MIFRKYGVEDTPIDGTVPRYLGTYLYKLKYNQLHFYEGHAKPKKVLFIT